MEYIEKLAILDVLFEPFLNEYFTKYNSFPFSHEGFLGHETAVLNVFTFWKHYRNKYAKELGKVIIPKEDYD